MKNQKYTICYKKHDTRSWDRVVVSTHKSTVSILNKMIDSYQFSDIKIFELTNISINETLSRTIITSGTTLLALISIYLFFFVFFILTSFLLHLGVLILLIRYNNKLGKLLIVDFWQKLLSKYIL